MRYSTLRSHLKPYVIVSRRKTTINHAFAAAIAPSDDYDELRIREALAVLGQDPDQDLLCAYCRSHAQTWDHVFATVKESHFSGHGHRLGNLLPCCKRCNSAKGNKDWRTFLAGLGLPTATHQAAADRIDAYLAMFSLKDLLPLSSPEYERLLQVRREVLQLLAEADELAKRIRAATRHDSPEKVRIDLEPITRDRVDELLQFLPQFEHPSEKLDPEWHGQSNQGDVLTLPHPTYPPAVTEFFEMAGRSCWSDYGYDPAAAEKLIHSDTAIESASLAQIRTMITFCVRGERFCAGHWGAMIFEGRIVAILRRLQQLRREAQVTNHEP